MIFIVGDSHTEAFYDEGMKDYFRKIHLPLATAYNSSKHIPYIKDQINILSNLEGKHQSWYYPFDKEKDYLFFCFGEIDIRCHLGFKSEEDNTSFDEEVQKCVSKYTEIISYFSNLGYKVGVYGPIASGKSQKTANTYKSYKDYKIRNVITNEFNREMAVYCDRKGFIFKTLFYEMCDSSDYDSYFAEDQLHLNSGMFYRGEKDIDIKSTLINLFYG
jgi:hypothetical protein